MTYRAYRLSIPVLCLSAIAGAPAAASGLSDSNARAIYEMLYQRRGSEAVHSGRAVYLRRLESNPHVDAAQLAAEQAEIEAGFRQLQGDELWELNKDEVLAAAALGTQRTVETFHERYVFDSGGFLVESATLAVPADAPLRRLGPAATLPVASRATYSRQGLQGVALTTVDGKPTVVVSDLHYRMAPVHELGRAADKMPSLATMDSSLPPGMLPMSLSVARHAPENLLLTVGSPASEGFVFEIEVDPALDFAVRRSIVRFGEHVVVDEVYEDFIAVGTLWTPRYSRRTNYRLEHGRPVLQAREEFVLLGTPSFNGPIPSASLQIDFPTDAEVVDTTYAGPVAPAAPAKH